MSFAMGLYSFSSSAVHFCPDENTCGYVQKPATLRVCIIHSDDTADVAEWLDQRFK